MLVLHFAIFQKSAAQNDEDVAQRIQQRDVPNYAVALQGT